MASKTIVEAWYDNHAELEQRRLDDGRLEFEVTMRIVNQCIAAMQLHQARVLDIGGGPGRYAIQLAKQGHRVTLNDLSEECLEIAKKNATTASVNLDAVVHANALNIDQHTAPESFDVVLCLGPLYHLHESQQRIAVIDNAIQVTKQGGYIILAYVTIFAHLRDMARRQPSRLFNEWDFYKVYLTNGEYTRRSDNVSFHAYPKMIEKELQPFERQVHVERVVSCEGFAGFHGGKYLANLDENEMKCWVDVILMSAEDKETCNSADHLLVILRKQ